jgi:AraC family transcriptional activator of tynA and feaB
MHSYGEPDLDHEAWIELMRSLKGRYTLEGVEPQTFAGWMRPRSICGFEALDFGCNVHRVERTHRDVRLDGVDLYCLVFQFAGQATVVQNDQTVQLAVGELALVDSAKPVTYFAENRPGHWLSLPLPRQSLVSHLGSEPQGGLCKRGGTLAVRLLYRLVLDAIKDGDLEDAWVQCLRPYYAELGLDSKLNPPGRATLRRKHTVFGRLLIGCSDPS